MGNKKVPETRHFQSRGRGDRTPVNGFGDRRTTAVLFPYVITDELYCSTGCMGLAREIFKFFKKIGNFAKIKNSVGDTTEFLIV